jgi:SpoVK/Ycf46/Vps4 family AAA+-type ATPase
MKATLLKRLFSALEKNSNRDVISVCNRIVEEERQLGHTTLAKELEQSLKRLNQLAETNPDERKEPSFRSLPSSRREAGPLVQVLDRTILRHHMVLADEVEERFQRIEKEYAARTRLAKYGLRASRRILLYGPPGCGKSLGAERLAWCTGLPLQKVRFDTLISSYFGETASNLQRVFAAAEQHPVALFLDECDTIAQERGRRQDVGEVSRVVKMLLQLLEDFKGEGMVIAATNLYDSLDKALFRRFDEALQIPLPGMAEIVRLLEVTLSALSVDEDVDFAKFARSLDGYSCNDVEKIAQSAAKRAVMESRRSVMFLDLEIAAGEIRNHV